MMLVITLPSNSAIPKDILGRPRWGYDPEMSQQEIVSMASSSPKGWTLGDSEFDETMAVIRHQNKCVALAEIKAKRVTERGRFIFTLSVLQDHAYDVSEIESLMAAIPTSRRVPKSLSLPSECLCGCGTITPNRFLAGHATKALYDRANLFGGVEEFMEWFDALDLEKAMEMPQKAPDSL